MFSSQSDNLISELRENDPTQANRRCQTDNSFNGVLIRWEGGRKMIFYYAFLISVRFLIEENMNLIVMKFTSEIVTLRGYLLHTLFMRFTHEKPLLIDVIDNRYVVSQAKEQPIVIEVIVEDKK